jgi:phage shock protein A
MSHEIVDKLIQENTELKNNLEVHANMAVQLTVTRNELMTQLEKLNEKIKVLESHPKIVKINKNDDRTFVSTDDLFEIRRSDKAEIKRLSQLLNGC